MSQAKEKENILSFAKSMCVITFVIHVRMDLEEKYKIFKT